MKYYQIEYFLGIVRHRTITAAAEALNVSPSSLSAALKSLEQEFNAPLFDRTGRSLTLNENGKFFLRRAENIEGLFNETTKTMKRRSVGRMNSINCALHTPIGNPGALVAGFKRLYPDYQLRLGFIESGSFGVFSEDDIDVNIVATPLHLEEETAVLLGSEEYAMALPLDHPLINKADLKLADFADQDFVASVGGKSISCFDPAILCQEAGFEPNVVCEVQWQTDAMELVEAGVGCCIVPEYTWLANKSYKLAVRHFSDVKHHRHIYAQLAGHKRASKAVLDFVEYLQNYARSITSFHRL